MAKAYESLLKENIVESEAEEREWASKKWAWVPAPKDSDGDDAWTRGEVVSEKGDTIEVLDLYGEKQKYKKALSHKVNPPRFDGVEDCGHLTELNEPAVLHNLRLRYLSNRIHSYSGLFLVTINPYKWLNIYGEDIIEMYRGVRREDIAPHVFGIADESYRTMLENRRHQSILITGESGAGKTENTKKVLAYLTHIAGQTQGRTGSLEKAILQANPVLEAFGNAKTTRNDNSSRFGKFIQVQFTKKGIVCGAAIQHYLLELSRVTAQAKNERNFHIFYQLFAGCTEAELQSLHLTKQEDYYYLNQTGTYENDQDDKKEYQEVVEAYNTIGILEKDQEAIRRIVASLLHMGNVRFKENEKEEASVVNDDVLSHAAALLCINKEDLERVFLHQKLKVGPRTLMKNYNKAKAKFARDAIVKEIYQRLFDWLVRRINATIDHQRSSSYFIGILDIAGFEIFEENSFEQLCINYTNERLQQFFNNHMFKVEQEEYAREKIQWEQVDFGLDLEDSINLIEKNGILTTLDEECVFPGASDKTFLEKCHQRLGPKYPKAYEKPRIADGGFSILHYAGKVHYNVHHWLRKNMNPLSNDVTEVMRGSQDAFIQSLFWGSDAARMTKEGSFVGIKGASRRVGGGRSKKKAVTIAGTHKMQLFKLMDTLQSTDPHFIRCIKPNHEKQPMKLVGALCEEQLRCNGVLEGIRIARRGYPNRVPFTKFQERFHLLVTKKLPADPRKACVTILKDLAFDQEAYQVGRTKAFFRSGKLADLEHLRDEKMNQAAYVIQRSVRHWIFRKRLSEVKVRRKACRVIQRGWRSFLYRRDNRWFVLMHTIRPMLKHVNIEQELKERTEEVEQLGEVQKQLHTELAESRNDAEKASAAAAATEAERSALAADKARLETALASARRSTTMLRFQMVAQVSKARKRQEDLGNQVAAEMDRANQAEKTLKLTKVERDEGLENFETEKAARLTLEAKSRKLSEELDDTQSKVETETDRTQHLQKQNKELESEIARLKRQVEALEDTNATQAKTLDDTQHKVEELQDDLETERRAHQNADKKWKRAEARIRDLEGDLEGISAKEKKGEETRKELGSEMSALQEQLSEETEQREQVETRLMEIQRSLEAQKQTTATLEGKLAHVEKDLRASVEQGNTLQNDLEAEQAHVVQGEKSQKKVEEERDALQQNLTETERLLGVTKKAKKKVEGELSDTEKKVEELRRKLSEKDDECHNLEAELERFEEQSQMAERQIAALERKNKSAENRLADLTEELDEVQGKASKSNSQLRREMMLVREQLEEEEEARSQLEDIKRQQDAQIEELLKREEGIAVAKVDAMKKEWNAKLEEKQVILDDLEESIGKLQRKEKELSATIQERDEALSQERAALEKQQHDSHKMEKDIQRLSQELENERTSASGAETKLREAENTLAALRREKEETEEESRRRAARSKKKMSEEIAELQSQLDSAEEDAKRAIAKAKIDMASLTEQLETAEESASAAEEEVIKLKAEIQRLREEVDSRAAANAAEAKFLEEKKRLRAAVDEAEAQAEEAQSALASEKKKAKSAQDELNQMHITLDTAEADLRQVKSALKDAQKEMQAVQQRADAAESALTTVKKEMEGVLSKLSASAEDLAAEQSRRTATERKLKGVTRELEELREEVEDSSSSSSKLKSQVKAAQAEASTLREEMEGMHVQMEDTEKELGEIRIQFEEAKHELEEVRGQVARESRKAKSALRDVEDLQSDLQDEQARSKRTLQRLKSKLQGENDELQQQLASDAKRRSDLHRKCRQLEREARGKR